MPIVNGGDGAGVSTDFENKVQIGTGMALVHEQPNLFNPLNTDSIGYIYAPVSFAAAPDNNTTRSPQYTVEFTWKGDRTDLAGAFLGIYHFATNPDLWTDSPEDWWLSADFWKEADLASLPGGGLPELGVGGGLQDGTLYHATASVELWPTVKVDPDVPDDYRYASGNPPGSGPWFPFNIGLIIVLGQVFQGGIVPSAEDIVVYQTWNGDPLPDPQPCPEPPLWPYPPETLGIDGPDTGVIRVGLR